MLTIENLHKRYGTLEVLRGVSLTIPRGQAVAVIGPSGAGKSTLLRCINYLEIPQEGRIELDGAAVDAAQHTEAQIRALRRKTSMVFQNYNLFANKTCLENVSLPLEMVQHIPREQAREQASALLKRVGVLDKADEYPSHLSGGQQQRVGIARALAVNPACILFDEPTSSLDPELVSEVLEVIRQIAQDHNRIMLIVTHEMNFAREVADRILFMEDGVIIADETSEVFFSQETASPRISRFLEQMRGRSK